MVLDSKINLKSIKNRNIGTHYLIIVLKGEMGPHKKGVHFQCGNPNMTQSIFSMRPFGPSSPSSDPLKMHHGVTIRQKRMNLCCPC